MNVNKSLLSIMVIGMMFMLVLPNVALATFGDYTGDNFSISDTIPRGVDYFDGILYTLGDTNNLLYFYYPNGTQSSNVSTTSIPIGVWVENSTYYYILDHDGYVRQYLTNGTYTNWNFSVASQGTIKKGLTGNDTYFWYMTGSNFNLHRYFRNGTYDGVQFSGSGIWSNPQGLDFNGTHFYTLTGHDFTTIHLINQNGTAEETINISSVCDDAEGITSNGTYMWITCTTGDLMMKFADQYEDPATPLGITVDNPTNTTYYADSVWANATVNDTASSCWVQDDATTNYTMTNSTGNWNYQLTSLSAGSHNAVVFCNDSSSNEYTSATTYYTVDLLTLGITVLQPSNTTYYTDTTNVLGFVNDTAELCWVEDDSTTNYTMDNSSGNWEYNLTSMSHGNHHVKIFCNNTYSNEYNSSTTYYTIDLSTPIGINFSYPENKSYKWNDPNGMFTRISTNVTNTSVDTCWLEEDSTTNHSMINDDPSSWYAPYDTLANQTVGTHNLTAYCNDTVGTEYASPTLYYTYVDTNISDCMNITADGLTYDLNASMVDTQPLLDYCIRVQASDVVLDCNGYSLTGSATGTGIWATISGDGDYNNITIKNCKVYSYDYGIRVSGNDSYRNPYINIYNNSANSCGSYGIALDRTRDSNITENEALANLLTGIYVSNGNNTLVNNNTANNQTIEDGLYFDDCDYCISQYNILNYNNETGFHIASTSINTQSIGDTAIGNGVYDFYSTTANDNLLVSLFDMGGTIVDFTLGGDIGIKLGTAIATDGDAVDIGKWVEATNESAGWLFLNVTYEDSDLGTAVESSLRMWLNDGSWSEVSGSGVSILGNYVYGNTTTFGTLAPLGTSGFDVIEILSAMMILLTIIGVFMWIKNGNLPFQVIVGLLLVGMALVIILASVI